MANKIYLGTVWVNGEKQAPVASYARIAGDDNVVPIIEVKEEVYKRQAECRGGYLEECRFPLLGIPLPGAWLLLLRRRPHGSNRLRQPYLDGSAAHRYAH